jgi:hypothetical protein
MLCSVPACDDGIGDVIEEEKTAVEQPVEDKSGTDADDVDGNIPGNSTDATSDDVNPPLPGGDGAVNVLNSRERSIHIMWIKAEDDVTAQEDLQYMIYYSDEPVLESYEDSIEYAAPYTPGWTIDINNVTITGLEPGTTYYLNVLVRDEAENVACYTMAEGMTQPVAVAPTD